MVSWMAHSSVTYDIINRIKSKKRTLPAPTPRTHHIECNQTVEGCERKLSEWNGTEESEWVNFL